MKTRKNYQLARRAFTLIELLIVIAIIGILAGAILISTNKARQDSKTVSTLSTLASLKGAVANCCTKSSNNLMLPATDPVAMSLCRSEVSTAFPAAAKLNAQSVAVTISDCDQSNPAIGVKLIGHANTACNSLNLADNVNFFRITGEGVEKRGTTSGCK